MNLEEHPNNQNWRIDAFKTNLEAIQTNHWKRKYVFASNLTFIFDISIQPGGINL